MPILGRVAGIFAIVSGLASVALFASLDRFEWLITAWNLSIIPTALYLGVLLARRSPLIAATATLAGISAVDGHRSIDQGASGLSGAMRRRARCAPVFMLKESR